ncbi:hypothetical protein EYF80_058855 [Liparis tanakae]|uniref:Uncharacterized protein n=1 Tax=Liparis tanakae TaxID=230148 RepID=A0A4Z2EQZ1_9TELE|nr:hypothetical protein EYF80_058855 [Liparis tanakae]
MLQSHWNILPLGRTEDHHWKTSTGRPGHSTKPVLLLVRCTATGGRLLQLSSAILNYIELLMPETEKRRT